jgi:hypothetical protein
VAVEGDNPPPPYFSPESERRRRDSLDKVLAEVVAVVFLLPTGTGPVLDVRLVCRVTDILFGQLGPGFLEICLVCG